MNSSIYIATSTARELFRDKIIYAVFSLFILVVLISLFFGTVSIGSRVQVLQDFGLFSCSIFSLMFCAITGTSLLNKEIKGKTIHNIMSKPIKRSHFIFGKFLGMVFASSLLNFILILFLFLFVRVIEGFWNDYLLIAGLYITAEIILVNAVGILFSSAVVTPMLAGLFTVAAFMVGRSANLINEFIATIGLEGTTAKLFNALYYIIPNFSYLNASGGLVFNYFPGWENLIFGYVYVIGYSVIMLVLANYFFKKRELL